MLHGEDRRACDWSEQAVIDTSPRGERWRWYNQHQIKNDSQSTHAPTWSIAPYENEDKAEGDEDSRKEL